MNFLNEKPTQRTLRTAPGDLRVAARLHAAAKSLYAEAERKRNPATAKQRVTVRRAGIADRMAREGDSLERRGKLLDALANAHEAGTVHPLLAGITTRAALESVRTCHAFPDVRVPRHAARSALEKATAAPPASRLVVQAALAVADPDDGAIFTTDESIAHCEAVLTSGEEEYHAGLVRDTAKARARLRKAGIFSTAQLKEAQALLEAMEQPASAPGAAQRIAKLERALLGMDLPGYFPTPPRVVALLVERADIEAGHRVLEPSAGKGNIADALRLIPGVVLDVVEFNTTLREILEAKGYTLAGQDFLQYHAKGYDRVVMNPPFEGMQDVDHILHAYDLLAPGGRLVSVASASPFFHKTRKATDFRAWLDKLRGHSERLPEGSFLSSERSVGVNAYLVVVDKPGEDDAP